VPHAAALMINVAQHHCSIAAVEEKYLPHHTIQRTFSI